MDRVQAAIGGRKVQVTVEAVEEKRTNPQNDFMHPTIRQILKNQGWGCSETVARQILLTECFGEKFAEAAGRKVQIYPETKKFNKQQMSHFIEWLLWYSSENGIPQLMPDTYAKWAREVRV